MSDIASFVLGSTLVSSFASRTFTGTRVLAYHDVPSEDQFESNVRAVLRWCDPVDPSAPGRPNDLTSVRNRVLITFDDGHASVVENALPVLLRLGVPALMFVSPGIASGDRVFWWDAAHCVESSGARARVAPHLDPERSLVDALKNVRDSDRRTILERAMNEIGPDARRQAATPEQLRTWRDAGMTLGNHTWDHPCLDQCTEAEQRHQVQAAHAWLDEFVGGPPTFFAYPNGDWTIETETLLIELGYEAAYLFDHRLDRSTNPLRRSRLRIDAGATTARTRAIVSGAHSAAFNQRRKHRARLRPESAQ